MSVDVLQAKVSVEPIKTGLKKSDRSEVATHVSDVLSDTMSLMIKTQIYHWNVVGPLFKAVHELTEAHYKNLFEAVDVIAERVRSLGFPAPFHFSKNNDLSALLESTDYPRTEEMVDDLIKDHASLVRKMRDSAEGAEQAGDFVTHDLLVGRMAFHEKAIWMLRALRSE